MIRSHEENSEKRAIVIGGGIGGLCTAIALQAIGWQVDVYEKSIELKGIGAGIVLAANAMKALDKLGVAKQIRQQGAPVRKAEIRAWNGKLLVDMPVEEQAKRHGTDSFIIHRAELQRILYHRLKHGTVHLRKKLISWEQSASKVSLLFADGDQVEGDVLIGADGVNSVVREILWGKTPLRYSGFSALRGICHFQDKRFTEQLGGGFEAWGAGKRFGFSHLGNGRIFWFAAINALQGNEVAPNERKKAALQHFRGWCKPIEAVIDATEEREILSHDIFDRKPLRQWSQGRVTLLGDAAHPMQPNLGQGGAQAIEDALVLSRYLQGNPTNISNALQVYEQSRIKRTSLIVHRSRMMGKLMQLENSVAIELRNTLLRTIPVRMQLKRLEWLIGYEI